MNQEYAIVILNRYPELARNLIASIRRFHKLPPEILVVCDRHQEPLEDCKQRFMPGPFVYARNSNDGIQHMAPKNIILCNDDCECVEDNFFETLHGIAASFPKLGVLSALIDGGVGNPWQQWPQNGLWKEYKNIPWLGLNSTICFPCVYLKRKMIDDIGLLDEDFVGYGMDDDDYCLRAREAGWVTAITPLLKIKHGSGGSSLERGKNWSVSFVREPQKPGNLEIFLKKHPNLIQK